MRSASARSCVSFKELIAGFHGIWRGDRRKLFGSGGYDHSRVDIISATEYLPEVETESTVIDSTTNLKQRIGRLGSVAAFRR
jgi:hypothetical protein